MIAFHRTEGADYSINYVPEDVNLICNQEKTVPPEWITGNGSDIGQAFIDYALPTHSGDCKRAGRKRTAEIRISKVNFTVNLYLLG